MFHFHLFFVFSICAESLPWKKRRYLSKKCKFGSDCTLAMKSFKMSIYNGTKERFIATFSHVYTLAMKQIREISMVSMKHFHTWFYSRIQNVILLQETSQGRFSFFSEFAEHERLFFTSEEMKRSKFLNLLLRWKEQSVVALLRQHLFVHRFRKSHWCLFFRLFFVSLRNAPHVRKQLTECFTLQGWKHSSILPEVVQKLENAWKQRCSHQYNNCEMKIQFGQRNTPVSSQISINFTQAFFFKAKHESSIQADARSAWMHVDWRGFCIQILGHVKKLQGQFLDQISITWSGFGNAFLGFSTKKRQREKQQWSLKKTPRNFL